MNIPRKLKIGGRVFKVKFPYLFKDSSQVLYGQCDHAGQVIMVSETDAHGARRHSEGVAQTFLHEILHAIDNVYCCGKIGSEQNGEEIIDQLAEGLLQVINDNHLEFSGKGRGK